MQNTKPKQSKKKHRLPFPFLLINTMSENTYVPKNILLTGGAGTIKEKTTIERPTEEGNDLTLTIRMSIPFSRSLVSIESLFLILNLPLI